MHGSIVIYGGAEAPEANALEDQQGERWEGGVARGGAGRGAGAPPGWGEGEQVEEQAVEQD